MLLLPFTSGQRHTLTDFWLFGDCIVACTKNQELSLPVSKFSCLALPETRRNKNIERNDALISTCFFIGLLSHFIFMFVHWVPNRIYLSIKRYDFIKYLLFSDCRRSQKELSESVSYAGLA